MWMLRTKFESFGRAASVPNCRAIAPAPLHIFLKIHFHFQSIMYAFVISFENSYLIHLFCPFCVWGFDAVFPESQAGCSQSWPWILDLPASTSYILRLQMHTPPLADSLAG